MPWGDCSARSWTAAAPTRPGSAASRWPGSSAGRAAFCSASWCTARAGSRFSCWSWWPGLSALLTAAGATLAITGLQLLVYTILGTSPLGAERPWWLPPLLLLAGVGWAILLLVPAWLTAPLAAEQRSTAQVYRALARMLRAAGTPEFPAAHQAVVAALNQAWDDLASRRIRASGRDPELNRVAALLRQTHPLTEAAVTLVHEGSRPRRR